MPITHVRGKAVVLPDTLDGIREALPEERRAEFDRVIGSTPLRQIAQVALMEFALPEEAHEESLEQIARLRAGDFSGLHNADGTPFVPPEAPE
ncbi:hypothetical protein [Embleya scabrispora]|uniref:hypothetical protein n=1 Tax=Embleya scabrispora TaxID=159449 RepID=UPI000367356F|nr:hypothetical protein [Embleya scabrispora]MYS82758.1 hypothetical protein [Streptomyces sp. SID5474]